MLSELIRIFKVTARDRGVSPWFVCIIVPILYAIYAAIWVWALFSPEELKKRMVEKWKVKFHRDAPDMAEKAVQSPHLSDLRIDRRDEDWFAEYRGTDGADGHDGHDGTP